MRLGAADSEGAPGRGLGEEMISVAALEELLVGGADEVEDELREGDREFDLGLKRWRSSGRRYRREERRLRAWVGDGGQGLGQRARELGFRR